ncbi:PadR family transcriptional regulator [Sphaerisporangium sp. TRM90804]|uniref:PadR family transcriptional regulator n=1 Tax=Sphaerisporangium sp. TRM90804 TaxID=3031113 RepID=UPI002446D681|nr:PadR family transcriptional regulator [Sphaerisporangium sp. TRM90804]MDH2424275.1 PadR family transcriptional regulator [Sphaerisporangium sp. TRM90804]
MTYAHSMGGGASWPHHRDIRAALGALAAWHEGHHGPPRGHRGPAAEGEHPEHRHRGRRGPGPFPWDFGRGGPFGPGFGGGFGGGRGPFGRGSRKAKRGDVRAAILALLAEEPRNGYQIIQEIARRSEGGWKPSPGAVYPALQQLTDEGLVQAEETDGRKTFILTEAGRAYVGEHPEEVRAPWEDMTPDLDEGVFELFDLSRQAAAALFQVAQTGSDAQVKQAKQVLNETRRKLYQILADGDAEE